MAFCACFFYVRRRSVKLLATLSLGRIKIISLYKSLFSQIKLNERFFPCCLNVIVTHSKLQETASLMILIASIIKKNVFLPRSLGNIGRKTLNVFCLIISFVNFMLFSSVRCNFNNSCFLRYWRDICPIHVFYTYP